MGEVYAEDAYDLPPGAPIPHGQDQFRGQFNVLEPFARNDRPGPQLSFEIVDRDVSGDLAYNLGVFTLRSRTRRPTPRAPGGKFEVIWKRIDGRWRIWADGFSPTDPVDTP